MSNRKPSKAALEYERLLVKLAHLMAGGRGDTEEGEAVRSAMEAPWSSMDAEEGQLMRHLSSDLYMLERDEMIDEAAATYEDVGKAWNAKDYELVLALLRKSRDRRLAEDKVAYVRGRAWGELGYREAALAFTTYAADVSPQNGTYTFLALVDAMDLAHIDEALARARAIEADASAPIRSSIAAAHALLRFDPDDGALLYERAAALLSRAIEGQSRRPPAEQLPGLLTEAYVELGMCRELLGDADAALAAYSNALKADPKNDVALTARGLLQMNTDERAAERDFERAVETATPLVWPYLYLAPMRLRRGEYRACIQVCSAALKLAQEDEQRANFYEWLAIAHRALQTPEPVVLDLFAMAEERAPLNPRIDANRLRQGDWDVVLDTSLEDGRQRFRDARRRQLPMLAAA
jgi:tetratricopeptide (TPR) repeat protein